MIPLSGWPVSENMTIRDGGLGEGTVVRMVFCMVTD